MGKKKMLKWNLHFQKLEIFNPKMFFGSILDVKFSHFIYFRHMSDIDETTKL